MAEHRRRRATPSGGGKPLAPFGLRAAQTRLPCCGSSMMLGHHPRRRASYPVPRRLQHGLSDFCHGLLSPRSEDHGSHRGLAQFRREPAGSPHCIVVRDAKAWPLISWSLRDGGLSGTSPSCRHRGHRCGFPIWSAGVHCCWHRMPRMRHGKLELDLAFGKIRCHWVKARVVEGNVAPARIRGKGGYRLIEG